MTISVTEIERLLNIDTRVSVYGTGYVDIDGVDYYDENNNMTTVYGYIEMEPFIMYLEDNSGSQLLKDIDSTLSHYTDESDENKLDAIIDLAPQMFDDGVLGVFLEI
mgnify:CR=1 FL=1